ncbi:type 4a pilus biogenesis protein PilO [Gemmatimonadota bacterium]
MALVPDDPKQQRALVAIILAVGLFYVFWTYMYTPQRTEVETLETRLEDLNRQNEAARQISVRGGTNLEDQLVLYERFVVELERLIPRSEEVAFLLNQINQEARRVGVDVTAVRPEPEETVGIYVKETYQIDVVGDYHNIARFLTTIASLPRIITPVDLELIPYMRDRSVLTIETEFPLEAHLFIQTYVVPDVVAAPPPVGGEGQAGGGS